MISPSESHDPLPRVCPVFWPFPSHRRRSCRASDSAHALIILWVAEHTVTAFMDRFTIMAGVRLAILLPFVWACGDGIGCRLRGNDCSILIERNLRRTDRDYQTVAELMHNLRPAYRNLPLCPHKHWSNTACPGTYDLAHIDRMVVGGQPAGKPANINSLLLRETGARASFPFQEV